MAEENVKYTDYVYKATDLEVTISAVIEYPEGNPPKLVYLTSDKKEPEQIVGSANLEQAGAEEESKEGFKKDTWKYTYNLRDLRGLEEGEKFLIYYEIQDKAPTLLAAAKVKEDTEEDITEKISSLGVEATPATTEDKTGIFGKVSGAASEEDEVAIPNEIEISVIPKGLGDIGKEGADQVSEDFLKGYNIYRLTSESQKEELDSEDLTERRNARSKYKINADLIPYYTEEIKNPDHFTKIDSTGYLVDENGESWYQDVYIDRNLPPIPPGGRTFYYLVTAVDESGNESEYSEWAVDIGPESSPTGVGIFVRKDISPPATIEKIDFDLSVPNSIGLYWGDSYEYPRVKNVFAVYDRVSRFNSVVWDTTEESMPDTLIGKLDKNENDMIIEAGIGKVKPAALFDFGSFDDTQLYGLGSDFLKTGFQTVVSLEHAMIDACNRAGKVHPAFLLALMKNTPEEESLAAYDTSFESMDNNRVGILKINKEEKNYKRILNLIETGKMSNGKGLEYFNNGVISDFHLKHDDPNEKVEASYGSLVRPDFLKNPYFSFAVGALYLWNIKINSPYKEKNYAKEKVTEEEEKFFLDSFKKMMELKNG